MDRPAVAFRFGEEAEPAPRVVRDFGHVDAPLSRERVHLVDVVDVELDTPERSGCGVKPRRD